MSCWLFISQNKNHVIYYKLCFDEKSDFPFVKEAIRIDHQLHVQLRLANNYVPLLPWFTVGSNAKLTGNSMLQNFPAYLQNVSNNSESFLNELQMRQHCSPKGRPLYSSKLVRSALQLRYTSRQAYKLMTITRRQREK